VIVSASDLEQLRWLCHVATDAVERDLGFVLVRRTITDTFDGTGARDLQLRRVPPNVSDGGYLTITSVVENGITLSAGDYIVRRTDWTLRRGAGIGLYRLGWYWGTENITVTYVAGCTNPPPSCGRSPSTGCSGCGRRRSSRRTRSSRTCPETSARSSRPAR
jgi:hypothetical protein